MYNTSACAEEEGSPGRTLQNHYFVGPTGPYALMRRPQTVVIYLTAHQRNKMTEVLLRWPGDEASSYCLSCQLSVNQIEQ